ncbi:cytochrome C biogenesis protein CcmC [Alphaproteobacteria bacterium]|nr:cytochrome C biogenesis protein CcmC [Alphaproteobacteria bacterium]
MDEKPEKVGPGGGRKATEPEILFGWIGRILPWIGGTTGLLLGLGLYFGLFASPADSRQGEAVRIMYVHVPSAWIAMMAYCLAAAFSLAGLVRRRPLYHIAANAVAVPGAAFTFLCLATGSLWGRPMWGVWWSWDARLTSMLILLFLYFGFIALSHSFDDRLRGWRASSILILVGAVNVPIIKFSVDWWRTLHQPSSLFAPNGPAISSEMAAPLMLMTAGFTLFFILVSLLRLRTEIAAAMIRNMRRSCSGSLADGMWRTGSQF